MRVTVDMPTKEDWEILGLRPGASAADVKTAWRRLSRQTHPDAGGTDALFRSVTVAYERVLADVEYHEQHGTRLDVASEQMGAESRGADMQANSHAESRAATGPHDQERHGSRRIVPSAGTQGWSSILVRLGRCFGTMVPAVLARAVLLTWQLLKLAGRVVRFIMRAGTWPSSLRGVVALLVLALAAGWVVAHLLTGGAGAVIQDFPLAMALMRVAGTPWRRR